MSPMSKTRRPRPMPISALPVSLFGLAACDFADSIGANVETFALRGGRAISTAEARAFLAGAAGRESAVWIVVAHTTDPNVYRAGASAL